MNSTRANLLLSFVAASTCAFILLMSATPSAFGDVIELSTGHKIQGDVLKEQGGELFVDIGIDIVRVPLDKIKSRAKTEAEETVATSEKDQGIYQTARLPKKNVEQLTEEFGEGVVLIQTPGGLGSGFIINKRGYCVTNYHVIERETRIAATIFQKSEDGEFVRRRIDDVQIVALNPFFDLALLQIPAQEDLPFRPVYIAEDVELREGDDVFAIGNPLGLERSVSQGIISTRNRNFEGIVYIQTTTQINPGNSGGPLFNSRGEVIGVTNMKLLFGEGLGFAIPAFYLKHFLLNRDAFAFDKNNDNSGYRYLSAPRRRNPESPPAEQAGK
ncbi:MAG: trypsin-like peptidase domain-containing protein [Planctomycetaceae bacterium]